MNKVADRTDLQIEQAQCNNCKEVKVYAFVKFTHGGDGFKIKKVTFICSRCGQENCYVEAGIIDE